MARSNQKAKELATLKGGILGELFAEIESDIALVNRATAVRGEDVDSLALNCALQQGKVQGMLGVLDLIRDYAKEKEDGN